MIYKYNIKELDAQKCMMFAISAAPTHYNYTSRNMDRVIMNIYVGKLGEVGFKYLLDAHKITCETRDMFVVYDNIRDRDETDFKMPNGKKIDVKSTTGNWGIQVIPKHLHTQNYYVGTRVTLNKQDPLLDPIVEIRGCATPGDRWVDNKWGKKSLCFVDLADISIILNEWGESLKSRLIY